MNCYRIASLESEQEKAELVAHADSAFASVLLSAAEEIAETPKLRLLGLTGPTCSGKTTAANRLTECLVAHGHRVQVISLDDFFYDVNFIRNRAEFDPDAEIDYDSEDTLDIPLLQSVTEKLLAGKETELPCFDFRTGTRSGMRTFSPHPEDVFLFEGIQVLYPKVHAILGGETYRSLYICAASTIETGGELFSANEIRLMRRLVRDYRYRASPPEFTFYLWQSVRANEEANIFPRAHLCHNTIDSTHPYEIGMLKPYLYEMLMRVPEDNRFFGSAREILKKLVEVEPISSAYMTQNSLYKEFI